METIQYSLKNTYSINIAKIISQNENTHIQKNLDKSCLNLQDILNVENTNNKNNIFDNHCIKLYGKKTCILFYEDNYNIEVRLLDKITNISFNKIQETSLYKDIPDLLEQKYTVVIVKTIDSLSDKKEITDIHLPPS